jgi:toxin ParE1/3/4
MRRVVFRPEAEADLSAIALFIAEHSVDRARKFVERLRTRCKILESSPLAGRPRPEFGEGLRSLFERPYVLIYRIDGENAEILAVLRAARDLPATISARIAGKAQH